MTTPTSSGTNNNGSSSSLNSGTVVPTPRSPSLISNQRIVRQTTPTPRLSNPATTQPIVRSTTPTPRSPSPQPPSPATTTSGLDQRALIPTKVTSTQSFQRSMMSSKTLISESPISNQQVVVTPHPNYATSGNIGSSNDSLQQQKLLLAANQLLQIGATPSQLLLAANHLLAVSDQTPSPELFQTVHRLLDAVSHSKDSDQKHDNIPIDDQKTNTVANNLSQSSVVSNRVKLHQYHNLPYFGLTPAEPKNLPQMTHPKPIVYKAPNRPVPNSIPTTTTTSKGVARREAKARISTGGTVVSSRMASLHHPDADVPKFIAKSAKKNLTLDSTISTSDYIYTFIWTDPNTGEEVNISTSQVVNLQILIQATPSGGSCNSFQFAFPLGSSTDPGVLFGSSPNTPNVSISGWNITLPTTSSLYTVVVSNSSPLTTGTLLIVSINGCVTSSTPGVSMIEISEQGGSALGASIIKAPSYFILKDMYFTTAPDGSGSAVTAVIPGAVIYVTWIMYNPLNIASNIILYWNDTFSAGTNNVNVGTQARGLAVSPSGITINSDTTFTIVAQTPSGRTYQIQQTIKVINPIIQASTILCNNTGAFSSSISNINAITAPGFYSVNAATTAGGGSYLDGLNGNITIKGGTSANSWNVIDQKGAARFTVRNSDSNGANSGYVATTNNTLDDGSGNMLVSKLLTVGSLNILPPGVIVAFNSSTAPSGWWLCNGTQITGTTSTLNGQNAPNLSGRFILGAGSATGLTTRTLSATGGEEAHTLTKSEMPSHSHDFTDYEHRDSWGQLGHDIKADYTYVTKATNSVGSDQPHNNMPPFYVLTYIIKL